MRWIFKGLGITKHNQFKTKPFYLATDPLYIFSNFYLCFTTELIRPFATTPSTRICTQDLLVPLMIVGTAPSWSQVVCSVQNLVTPFNSWDTRVFVNRLKAQVQAAAIRLAL